MCKHSNAFSFNGQEYAQTTGLAMGSPLSPAAACFYMKRLEKEKDQRIVMPEITWV